MTLDELMESYRITNPASESAFKNASSYIPGGITANVKYFSPFPLFMKAGNGAYLTDLDNHTYIDYVLSYGPLIHGHGRKEILDAMQEYLSSHGTMLYGTPSEVESDFAKMIQSYFPSIEKLRFTNSGTEATLLSIRTACAYTKKYKIAKFEGHYHGGFNEVLVSVNPDIHKVGSVAAPNSVPESAGLPDRQLEDTIVLPFNDIDACTAILTAHQDEIAAVIMEPLFGGTIPADPDFMTALSALTKKLGILLIMDEVKTGFRITMGGAQNYYGITPDLTALGKVIGSGMPVGIVGGRRDIMELASPNGSDILDSAANKSDASEVLYHSGTYNGHPMILYTGLKTIELLEKEFPLLLKRTEDLKSGIHEIFASHGIKVLTPGLGSMFQVAITEQNAIRTYRELQACDFNMRKKLDYALLSEGIYNKPGNRYNMSTAHNDAVIDQTLEAFKKAFTKI